EAWAGDALAVMDDVGSDRPRVLAPSGGALPAVWLAARHPERVHSLVLVNGTPRVLRADDYSIGVPGDVITDIPRNIETPRGGEDIPNDIAIYVPSLAHRVGFREWWGRAARRGASPTTAIAWNLMTFSADVREHLASISCPTLVISRSEAFADLVEHGRFLSNSIRGARF